MSGLKYIRTAASGFMPALVIPDFKSKKAEVRWKVRHLNLCALDRETRQAAAADPAIIWDATIRQYRLRRRSDPAPSLSPLQGPAGCASAEQPDRTVDPLGSAPAPGNRGLDPIAGALGLDQPAADSACGGGGSER